MHSANTYPKENFWDRLETCLPLVYFRLVRTWICEISLAFGYNPPEVNHMSLVLDLIEAPFSTASDSKTNAIFPVASSEFKFSKREPLQNSS